MYETKSFKANRKYDHLSTATADAASSRHLE